MRALRIGDNVRHGNRKEIGVVKEFIEPRPGWHRAFIRWPDSHTEQYVDDHQAVADVAAFGVGLGAGVSLNKRYPEGVKLPGPLPRVPASVAGGGAAIGAGVIARQLDYERTGRALIVGGVGAGVAAIPVSRAG